MRGQWFPRGGMPVRKSLVTMALALAVTAGLGLGLVRAAAARSRSAAGGVREGELRDCPGPPNCVSSFARDATHAVEPLERPAEELDSVVDVALEALPRTRLVARSRNYAHLECRSRLFGFRDDLELLASGEVIHVRSASRWGRGDLGVNRRRVESLRALAITDPVSSSVGPR